MIDNPPRTKEWVSWSFVGLWSGVIFLTIPFARDATRFVAAHADRSLFVYAVIVIVILAGAATLGYMAKRGGTTVSGYAWLTGVAALLLFLTHRLRSASPEEAIHYLQYGFLGLLIYRVLAHRIRDYGIYVAATIIGGMVGMIDETIQWLTPGRVFGLSDIWLNFTAVALVQVALAAGIKPRVIAGWPGYRGLARVTFFGAAAMVLFGAIMQNTPDRIAWYAERLPGLGHVGGGRSIMVEYGHLHTDPDIGSFPSRLTLAQIKQQDQTRAQDGADILNRYRDRTVYARFHKIYTVTADPFLHEVRTHLFRRDVNAGWAFNRRDMDRRREWATTAYRENQILEKYFEGVLRASSYPWSDDFKQRIGKLVNTQTPYVSGVSRDLITAVNPFQVLWLCLAAVTALLSLGRFFGGRARRG